MLALPAMALYVMEKTARLGSEPGRRKERARSVCVQSVREGSTTARNLWESKVSICCMAQASRVCEHTSSAFARPIVSCFPFGPGQGIENGIQV